MKKTSLQPYLLTYHRETHLQLSFVCLLKPSHNSMPSLSQSHTPLSCVPNEATDVCSKETDPHFLIKPCNISSFKDCNQVTLFDTIFLEKKFGKTKPQTISLVSNIFKLFRKLTSRVLETRIHRSNSSLFDFSSSGTQV